MYQTRSFYVNTIRAAVEEYLNTRPVRTGGLRVQVTHIDANNYTTQAHAESEIQSVVEAVGGIAERREQEMIQRHSRLAALRERLDAGEITEEYFLTEAYCFI